MKIDVYVAEVYPEGANLQCLPVERKIMVAMAVLVPSFSQYL